MCSEENKITSQIHKMQTNHHQGFKLCCHQGGKICAICIVIGGYTKGDMKYYFDDHIIVKFKASCSTWYDRFETEQSTTFPLCLDMLSEETASGAENVTTSNTLTRLQWSRWNTSYIVGGGEWGENTLPNSVSATVNYFISHIFMFWNKSNAFCCTEKWNDGLIPYNVHLPSHCRIQQHSEL